MNKKVFISMLSLCMIFLAGLYIAKIFFPQEFVLAVSNEKLTQIGTFIDSHDWLYYVCCGITAFATYYLFCGACKRSWKLNLKEIGVILAFIVGIRLIGFLDNNIATHVSISSFFLVPLICKHDLRVAAIVYTIHGLAQVLSLGIRNLPMYLISMDFVTIMVMTFECYIWLVLFYIVFNYKKEK